MANNIKSMNDCISSERMVAFDLNNRTAKYIIKSPYTYIEAKNPGSLEFTFCVNNSNQIVVMFNLEDSLYVYNESYELEEVRHIDSKYIDTLAFFDLKNIRQNTITMPQNMKIYYDKNREFYSIVSIHKQDLKTDGMLNAMDSKNWSISFYDEGFEKVGEYLFYGKKYYGRALFYDDNGFYILKQKVEQKDRKYYFVFDYYKVKYE